VVTRRRIRVRQLRPTEVADALTVVDEAFGVPKVRQLVELIRESGRFDPKLSLVAALDDHILGFVMLSPVGLVMSRGSREVLSLAPLAMARQHQRQGIGGALMRIDHVRGPAPPRWRGLRDQRRHA
jgi:putative acetyltransferase